MCVFVNEEGTMVGHCLCQLISATLAFLSLTNAIILKYPTWPINLPPNPKLVSKTSKWSVQTSKENSISWIGHHSFHVCGYLMTTAIRSAHSQSNFQVHTKACNIVYCRFWGLHKSSYLLREWWWDWAWILLLQGTMYCTQLKTTISINN